MSRYTLFVVEKLIQLESECKLCKSPASIKFVTTSISPRKHCLGTAWISLTLHFTENEDDDDLGLFLMKILEGDHFFGLR